MSVFRDFLLWLEEHQIGILSTIAIHLLIVSIILVLKIRTNIEREHHIMIDLAQIMANMDEIPEEQQQSTQEFVQNMLREYNIRDIPVSMTSERAVENIAKMVRDIKTEMNITDPKPQDIPAEITSQEEKISENEAKNYDEKFPVDAAGERTIHTGETTIKYELTDRLHSFIPYPGYKCRVGGKIVVNIVVNHNGYVIKAEINKSKSDSEDSCLTDEAQRCAERSRFNESSQTKQQGSITYIFRPQ